MPKVHKQKENSRPYDILKENDLSEEVININKTSNMQQATNTQPTMALSIPSSELIKEAARIREFRGDNEYDLTSFIREVEVILPLFESNPALQFFILQRYVINKIQGEALKSIRTLGNNLTWDQIKEELIKNFEVKDIYFKLHQKALYLRNFNNVSDYFNKLKNILDDLNTKYEFDIQKPNEFSPKANESAILSIFLNGIDPSLSSIIHSRNIKTLREAYHTLEQTNMLRHFNKKFYNDKGNNSFNLNHHQHNPHLQHKNPHSGPSSTNDRTNPRNNQNYNQYNDRVQPIKTPQNYYQQNRRENSTQSKQSFNSRSRQTNRYQDTPQPMDVDHIQTHLDSNENDETNNNIYMEENFQLPSHQQVYR